MISLVTTCKNRFEFLSKTIQSYVSHPLISEVIVVDFDSEFSVYDGLKEIVSMDKIKVLHVCDQPIWKIGLAQNIGLSFISNDFFLKIDSDVGVLSIDRYFELIKDGGFSFIRGMHSKGTSSGLIMARKELWDRVGGYNDWLMGWGYDDSDFYERISESSHGKVGYFSDSDFTEIKQVMAIKNSNARKLLTKFDFEDMEFVSDHRFTLMRNYIITKILPQSELNRLKFNYNEVEPSLYNVEIAGFEDLLQLAFPMIDLANIVALGLYKSNKSIQDLVVKENLDLILKSTVRS